MSVISNKVKKVKTFEELSIGDTVYCYSTTSRAFNNYNKQELLNTIIEFTPSVVYTTVAYNKIESINQGVISINTDDSERYRVDIGESFNIKIEVDLNHGIEIYKCCSTISDKERFYNEAYKLYKDYKERHKQKLTNEYNQN